MLRLLAERQVRQSAACASEGTSMYLWSQPMQMSHQSPSGGVQARGTGSASASPAARAPQQSGYQRVQQLLAQRRAKQSGELLLGPWLEA